MPKCHKVWVGAASFCGCLICWLCCLAAGCSMLHCNLNHILPATAEHVIFGQTLHQCKGYSHTYVCACCIYECVQVCASVCVCRKGGEICMYIPLGLYLHATCTLLLSWHFTCTRPFGFSFFLFRFSTNSLAISHRLKQSRAWFLSFRCWPLPLPLALSPFSLFSQHAHDYILLHDNLLSSSCFPLSFGGVAALFFWLSPSHPSVLTPLQ